MSSDRNGLLGDASAAVPVEVECFLVISALLFLLSFTVDNVILPYLIATRKGKATSKSPEEEKLKEHIQSLYVQKDKITAQDELAKYCKLERKIIAAEKKLTQLQKGDERNFSEQTTDQNQKEKQKPSPFLSSFVIGLLVDRFGKTVLMLFGRLMVSLFVPHFLYHGVDFDTPSALTLGLFHGPLSPRVFGILCVMSISSISSGFC
eukprot:m.241213 g.241213  ORF g.241213 m.241213 type:complete len:206 (+) comp18876_c0_seq1:47-664(+)